MVVSTGEDTDRALVRANVPPAHPLLAVRAARELGHRVALLTGRQRLRALVHRARLPGCRVPFRDGVREG